MGPFRPPLPNGARVITGPSDICGILFQARQGISWTTDLPENISAMITKYTDEILEENMLNKILGIHASVRIRDGQYW